MFRHHRMNERNGINKVKQNTIIWWFTVLRNNKLTVSKLITRVKLVAEWLKNRFQNLLENMLLSNSRIALQDIYLESGFLWRVSHFTCLLQTHSTLNLFLYFSFLQLGHRNFLVNVWAWFECHSVLITC